MSENPWLWQYQTADGADRGTSAAFPNQADAETWLGESWRGLLADGIDHVILLEGERTVYGPMSLHPQ